MWIDSRRNEDERSRHSPSDTVEIEMEVNNSSNNDSEQAASTRLLQRATDDIDDDGNEHARDVENTHQRDALDRRTRRKLDFILLPFLALLFLLNHLDKANIGNAETAGFTHDTGLSARDINVSMAVFFAVFVALQPVGAALGRRFGMRRWVPSCMSLWGLCTILHIWVRRRWQLILLRTAIAALEAGFYPTTVSYLSLFYTRYEFAVRLGFFYGQTAVAGVLGGILSWAVFSSFPDKPHDGHPTSRRAQPAGRDEWKSWEALFLIEGCITMTIALAGFLWLPRSANTAWFFDAEEKQWAEHRMRLDQSEATRVSSSGQVSKAHRQGDGDGGLQYDEEDQQPHDRLLYDAEESEAVGDDKSSQPITADAGLSRQDVLSAFHNYKIWYLLICNILSAIPATAFGVFMPLVVKRLTPSLALSPAASNLLAAPPFACGAVLLFFFTKWSDKTKVRIVPILVGLGVLSLGVTLTLLVPLGSYILRYASLCVLLSGSYIASPLTVAWLANNTPEAGKRAVMLGINGWGNLAGVFLSVLFTPDERRTGYTRSLGITLACVLASFAGFVVFRMLLVRENRWREAVVMEWTPAQRQREARAGDVEGLEQFPRGLPLQRWLWSKADVLGRRLGRDGIRRGDERLTFIYGL